MDAMNHKLWHRLYITVYFYLCLCSRVSAGHCNTLLVLSGLGLQHFLAASSLSTLLLPPTQTRRNRHRGRRLMAFRRRSLALCCLRTRTPPRLFFTGVWSRHKPVYQSHFLQGQKMWNSSPRMFRASFWKSLLTLRQTRWEQRGQSDWNWVTAICNVKQMWVGAEEWGRTAPFLLPTFPFPAPSLGSRPSSNLASISISTTQVKFSDGSLSCRQNSLFTDRPTWQITQNCSCDTRTKLNWTVLALNTCQHKQRLKLSRHLKNLQRFHTNNKRTY